jgi:MATE family multidrug resistance protein
MDETSREIAAEASALLGLAIPTLLIQFSFAAPPFLTASFIGRRFGLVYLGAYQLAFMIINLFTLSLLTGLFSASDTLTPQAFGAGNHREVGVIALRGFLGSLALVLPICFLLGAYLSDLFVALGVDPESSELAGVWYRIYVVALPFYGLYLALWKFLSAQNVMWPLIVSSLVSTCIILPVAMSLLVRAFGFEGSAMAFALYQVCQGLGVLVILIVYRPYHAACWPGLNEAWKEVFRWEPFVKFFHLGLGGIVATSEGKPIVCPHS